MLSPTPLVYLPGSDGHGVPRPRCAVSLYSCSVLVVLDASYTEWREIEVGQRPPCLRILFVPFHVTTEFSVESHTKWNNNNYHKLRKSVDRYDKL